MKTLNNPVTNCVENSVGNEAKPRTFSAACRAKLETLKASLVARLSREFSDVREPAVRQAVEEADALASLTAFPQLFLPTLAEEKVQDVRHWGHAHTGVLWAA